MKYFVKYDPKLEKGKKPPKGLPQGMECFPSDKLELVKKLNKKGCGVFQVVNDFDWTQVGRFKGRRIENVKKINYWCADFDDDSIEKQWEIVESFVEPTEIIRSHRSLHVYWKAIDGTKENYRAIQRGISEAFGADSTVSHPAVVLRAPGFYHMKNPAKPFLVESVYKSQTAFKEWTMIRLLERRLGTSLIEEPEVKPQKNKAKPYEAKSSQYVSDFFERLKNLDQHCKSAQYNTTEYL